jgi:DNA-binding XRE family transcriptional regulator
MKDNNNALDFIDTLVDESVSFGFALKTIRETEFENMTQKEFSKMLGVSSSRVSDIENNRYNVSVKLACAIATKVKQNKRYFVALALQDTVNNAGLDYTLTLA